MSKVIYCPVNAWDCPYFDANGCCMMYPDTDPINECEDFAIVWGNDKDYIVDLDKVTRCRDCAYLVEEAYTGAWCCECFDKYIEDIETCPYDDIEPDVDETFYDPYMGCDCYD